MRWHRLPLAALAAVALAGAVEAGDQDYESDPLRVGAAVGFSSQFDGAVLALDFLVQVDPSWTIVPNGSFTDTGNLHRWTAGVELQWNAPAHKLHRKLLAWAGAGMGVLTEDPEGPQDPTTTDLLANLVVGVGYDAPATPFLQMRVGLTDPADFAFSVGVRF